MPGMVVNTFSTLSHLIDLVVENAIKSSQYPYFRDIETWAQRVS